MVIYGTEIWVLKIMEQKLITLQGKIWRKNVGPNTRMKSDGSWRIKLN